MGPEADALHGPCHPRLHPTRTAFTCGRSHGIRLRAARPAPQHVVRARLRLLDARDVLRARHDHVVGEALGGHAPAVVADHRDRRRPRRRASASAAITFTEFPLVESASSASPCCP